MVNNMPIEVVSNTYADFGIIGCIVIAFFALLIWVVKTTEKDKKEAREESRYREDKLYTVIEVLSSELPEIRKAIEDINRKI